ncbi:glutathione metabolism protein [Marinomonas piezotolerans]|uniref:Glutathione metabolism protein n=1 Tax=Marinomonas piezotolerans TaxID=2213058 RepID=A0A370UC36_9GAMM|nr:MAPEG family protein [Marinomonas piezotolerans]RDL45363.1 glutathione metabolism protein [Marinomonas piezotolerans]
MITPIYAALLALLYVFLSARIIKLRVKYQVGIGDGDHPLLQRAIRVQANFGEYVPFALLLLWMYESMNGAPMLVLILGALLCVGRLLHAYGVSQKNETLTFRQAGMVITFSVMLISAFSIVLKYII